MRIVVAVWLAGALTASVSSPAPVWTGRWEIVADPYTAHGLAGLPDSICGASCTIRDTWRGIAIDRVSIFDLGLPDVLAVDQPPRASTLTTTGGSGWRASRTATALTIVGPDRTIGHVPDNAEVRFVLSRQDDLLKVEMTRYLEGQLATASSVAVMYRRSFADGW